MRQRRYPETMPVLTSYWLKTICSSDHKRGWWRELNRLFKQALRQSLLEEPIRAAFAELQNWIEQSGFLSGREPMAWPSRPESYRPDLKPEWVAPYVGRLLNEWLSAEVASILVEENELVDSPETGIPTLAIGRAIERLLVRERLSPGTLEMLLQPQFLSPRYLYPADVEILRDVVLGLLGRTSPAPVPVLPATLLAASRGSLLPPDFAEQVNHASIVQTQESDEIHVPIAPAQALRILKDAPTRIASILVTMDGRWWESENLQSGEQNYVVYRPGGRLRIDYSAEHAKLQVRWPETRLQWSGGVHFQEPFEIFGREWHAASWETDGDRTWLHLVFSRTLPVAPIEAASERSFRRARPAAVDIAWTALGNGLAAALSERNPEPIEQLIRAEFVPLGRALLRLAETMDSWYLPKREAIENQLRAVRYYQAELDPVYGRIPWRIVPAAIRTTLPKTGSGLLEVAREIFEGLPESPAASRKNEPSSQVA